MNYTKSLLIIFILLAAVKYSANSQSPLKESSNNYIKINKLHFNSLSDSVKQETPRKKFRAGGLFLGIGGGLNVPLRSFGDNSIPTFGILGRLDYSSTTIFPFVIGAEIDYFSYRPSDQFTTLNLLSTFRTHITSFGLNIEYSLARLFNSPYSIPFVTLDVKTNKISRDIDAGVTLPGLPAKDSKISFGAGVGVTLFVFDFYIKYNYMKELSNFGAYAKMKFPVIRF